jgi:hypothetical protein
LGISGFYISGSNAGMIAGKLNTKKGFVFRDAEFSFGATGLVVLGDVAVEETGSAQRVDGQASAVGPSNRCGPEQSQCGGCGKSPSVGDVAFAIRRPERPKGGRRAVRPSFN